VLRKFSRLGIDNVSLSLISGCWETIIEALFDIDGIRVLDPDVEDTISAFRTKEGVKEDKKLSVSFP